MKFIIFNLAVGAALIYLFAADGPELDRAAVRIQGATSEIKDRASHAFDRVRPQKGHSPRVAKADEKKKPIPAPSIAATNDSRPAPSNKSLEASVADQAGNQIATNQVNPQSLGKSSTPDVDAMPASKAAESTFAKMAPQVAPKIRLAPSSKPARQKTRLAASLPPVSGPAVAKRRKEILRGIAPERPRPVLKNGGRLMSADERRKRLYSLAEEMELLYAHSLSR